MKNTFKFFGIIIMVVIIGFTLAGCSSFSITTGPRPAAVPQPAATPQATTAPQPVEDPPQVDVKDFYGTWINVNHTRSIIITESKITVNDVSGINEYSTTWSLDTVTPAKSHPYDLGNNYLNGFTFAGTVTHADGNLDIKTTGSPNPIGASYSWTIFMYNDKKSINIGTPSMSLSAAVFSKR